MQQARLHSLEPPGHVKSRCGKQREGQEIQMKTQASGMSASKTDLNRGPDQDGVKKELKGAESKICFQWKKTQSCVNYFK